MKRIYTDDAPGGKTDIIPGWLFNLVYNEKAPSIVSIVDTGEGNIQYTITMEDEQNIPFPVTVVVTFSLEGRIQQFEQLFDKEVELTDNRNSVEIIVIGAMGNDDEVHFGIHLKDERFTKGASEFELIISTEGKASYFQKAAHLPLSYKTMKQKS